MPPENLVSIAALSFVFASVNGIKPCSKVSPSGSWSLSENCSISCSLHLLPVSDGESELPLCASDSSALSCTNHEDCRKHYVGSSCKKIPCACEEKSGTHYFFLLDHKFRNQIPSLKACTVSLKWLNPDDPIVPFPWKTLLVVFAIVASFAACLLIVRWLTPCIQAMQSKAARPRRPSEVAEGQPFTSIPLQETPSSNRAPRVVPSGVQRPLSLQRGNIYNQFFRSLRDNSPVVDKPPPYEVAIQEPPSYAEEYEHQPLNASSDTSGTLGETSNLHREPQTIPLNSVSVTSVNTI